MKKFLQQFRVFISKGNVLGLAVGVIIGGAFSTITTSLQKNKFNSNKKQPNKQPLFYKI